MRCFHQKCDNNFSFFFKKMNCSTSFDRFSHFLLRPRCFGAISRAYGGFTGWGNIAGIDTQRALINKHEQ